MLSAVKNQEISNNSDAAAVLKEAMELSGFFWDGEPDPGMPERHRRAEEMFRKILDYLRNPS